MSGKDDVELSGPVRRLGGVTAKERYEDTRLAELALGCGEHPFGDVQAVDAMSRLRQQEGEAAGAAAHVEDGAR